MYYSYQCPQCGQAISDWENVNNDPTYADQKLPRMVQEHYQKYHEPGQLVMTPDELLYDIKQKVLGTPEAPSNADVEEP